MLPNFLIIGVQKAASSWLALSLSEHPDIFMYGPGEVKFFNGRFDLGVEWYENQFSAWNGESAVGEKSPGYICDADTPKRIMSVLGRDVKLIANLRHPVDRAYSEYWHFIKHGTIPSDTEFRDFYAQKKRLFERSNYVEQIERYFTYFPKENMHFLIFEEMMQHPHEAIVNCYQFLNVSADFVPNAMNTRVNKSKNIHVFQKQIWSVRKMINRMPTFVREPIVRLGRSGWKLLPQRRTYQKISPEYREELFVSDFLPGVSRLEEILDRDLSIWYKESVVKSASIE